MACKERNSYSPVTEVEETHQAHLPRPEARASLWKALAVGQPEPQGQFNRGHKRSGGQQHDHSHKNRSPQLQTTPGDNHTHCRDDRSEGRHIQKTKNHEDEEAGRKGRVVAPQGRVQNIPESSTDRAGTRNSPHHARLYPGEVLNHSKNNLNESRHSWTTIESADGSIQKHLKDRTRPRESPRGHRSGRTGHRRRSPSRTPTKSKEGATKE